jgi:hypothetical protein
MNRHSRASIGPSATTSVNSLTGSGDRPHETDLLERFLNQRPNHEGKSLWRL